MNTLVIYDTTGHIISQMSGDVREPVGIPFLWVEIPTGKKIISVDTTVTPNIPIFEDMQKSEVELLNEQINELNDKLQANEEMNLMVLEAMAQVYETVLPFLPL